MRGKIADVFLEPADRIYMSNNFVVPISREDFGNLVDASREIVSRVLTEFEKDEIIRYNGKKLEIVNKKSLVMISANG
jgi:CRP-like cAMP-binding protein